MPEPTSGGDSTTPLDGKAFGIETPGETTPTNPAAPAEEQPAEAVKPEVEKEQAKPEASEKKDEDEQVKALRKKVDDSHKAVIDIVGEKFDMLDNKSMTDVQLREWFDKHPNIAEKANRSKKYKDQFRTLMERDPATKFDADLKAKREEQAKDEGADDDDDEEAPQATGEDKPLTASELIKLLDDRDRSLEERMLERNLKKERTEEATEFASKNGINEEQFEQFQKTAEAIYSTNDEMEFSSALQAAVSAFKEIKNSPVNVTTPQTASKTGVDAETEIDRIVSRHGVSKEMAANLVAQGKTADNIDLEKGVQLMPTPK